MPHNVLDRTKLLAARLKAAGAQPYLASALYSLTVVPSDRVPTMGVDRHWRCYVNPAFVDHTPVHELAAVWVHEVAHLLRDHHGRAGLLPPGLRHDHHRVNLAQDCEINDDLSGLPGSAVRPELYGLPDGQMFEQYLPGIPATPRCPAHCPPSPGSSGGPCAGSSTGSSAGPFCRAQGPSDSDGPACGSYRLDCGSGAHGRAMPWEQSDGPVVSPVEAAAIRRQTAQELRAHVKARGRVPGGWQRWAEEILEPTVDWRRALTGAVREAASWASGAVDYTYQRPSRRGAAVPRVVLPSLRRPMPRVAVVVDTSGSMGPGELNAVLGEVAGVLRAVGIGRNRVSVLSCDADVHTVRKATTIGDVVLEGGGGTDMRVGIEHALRGPERPHIIIVLTDGYTPWPDTRPGGVRVIAGLVSADVQPPPEWIETIRIPTGLTG